MNMVDSSIDIKKDVLINNLTEQLDILTKLLENYQRQVDKLENSNLNLTVQLAWISSNIRIPNYAQ